MASNSALLNLLQNLQGSAQTSGDSRQIHVTLFPYSRVDWLVQPMFAIFLLVCKGSPSEPQVPSGL